MPANPRDAAGQTHNPTSTVVLPKTRQTTLRVRVLGWEVASVALEWPDVAAAVEVGGVLDRGVKSVGRWYVGRMSR